jgi:hypothetical protein
VNPGFHFALVVCDTSAGVFGLVAVSWSMRGSARMASMVAGVVSVMVKTMVAWRVSAR